jgi:hypothetical protein
LLTFFFALQLLVPQPILRVEGVRDGGWSIAQSPLRMIVGAR